jgi:lipopolysaccharide export system protein LptC
VLLSSYWVFQIQQLLHLPQPSDNNDPDAYMEDIVAKRLNTAGILDAELISPRLVHYPQTNRTEALNPDMIFYSDQHPPWEVTAPHGIANSGLEVIYLDGNVKVRQHPSATSYEITLLTNTLTLYPDKDYAETSSPVTVLQHDDHVESVGMQINLAQGWVKLLSSARGYYAPHPTLKTH